MKKKPLVVLTGPTAVGKTKASIGLAKAIGGEIISADSMQVYEYMDIGSAKIRPEEMQGVPHYLIDDLKPWDEFHVVRFQQMAKNAMEQIYANGHIPIVVGGTGFYIQALLYDIDFTDTAQDDTYRAELENLVKEKGAAYLHNMLRKVDPKSAEDIHANNVKRVIRALEYYRQTGQKMSEHNEEERRKESPYEFVYFVLNAPCPRTSAGRPAGGPAPPLRQCGRASSCSSLRPGRPPDRPCSPGQSRTGAGCSPVWT